MTVWEISRLATWAYSRLEPDAALRTALGGAGRVFHMEVPQATPSYTPPDLFAVFQVLSALPVVCQGPTRAGVNVVLLIKVVGRNKSFSALAAALDRIEALMFGIDVTATVSGANWRFVVLERPTESAAVAYVERTAGGIVYRHAGRQWPIFMAAA